MFALGPRRSLKQRLRVVSDETGYTARVRKPSHFGSINGFPVSLFIDAVVMSRPIKCSLPFSPDTTVMFCLSVCATKVHLHVDELSRVMQWLTGSKSCSNTNQQNVSISIK